MLGAVATGILVPDLAVITRYATPILAIMVGSVSLTLTVSRFRGVASRGVLTTLAGHLLMPVLAFGIAVGLGLDPALVAGFVVLGAVTPELVTPTMTELADGDTALAAVVLVLTGVGATAFVPLSLDVLVGDAIVVDTTKIVEGLVLAVVAPMLVAVTIRHAFEDRVAPHEAAYGSVSAIAVVVIIGGVAAANADLLRAAPHRTALVVVAALALNGTGYAIGYLAGVLGTRGTGADPVSVTRTRIASTLSVGMRDFAVAAGLVLAAGLPAAASLPAIAFGVVEMTTSATIASRRT